MAKSTDGSMATISSSTLLESSDGIQASESPVRPTSTSADGNQASEFPAVPVRHEHFSAKGEVVHIDWICIPGARINKLTEAWEIEYMFESKPMDVILIGGLENVQRGRSGPSIVAAYEHFIDLVKWQGERNHPDEPYTCTPLKCVGWKMIGRSLPTSRITFVTSGGLIHQ